MRRFVFFAVLLGLIAGPALADNTPPYLKLAQELGTPHLADSTGPADKSRLLIHFVPQGQDEKTWTKMTTVSIVKVPSGDTQNATRGIVHALKNELASNHATIKTFDESPLAPVTCWFEFTADGEDQKGVVYSPAAGYVTVAQVGARQSGQIDDKDVAVLKGLIEKVNPG